MRSGIPALITGLVETRAYRAARNILAGFRAWPKTLSDLRVWKGKLSHPAISGPAGILQAFAVESVDECPEAGQPGISFRCNRR